jgi:hypothetical protein
MSDQSTTTPENTIALAISGREKNPNRIPFCTSEFYRAFCGTIHLPESETDHRCTQVLPGQSSIETTPLYTHLKTLKSDKFIWIFTITDNAKKYRTFEINKW